MVNEISCSTLSISMNNVERGRGKLFPPRKVNLPDVGQIKAQTDPHTVSFHFAFSYKSSKISKKFD